ncbi:MAG TPA: TIR domain-containing protein [Mycobacteriales bacterium]|nr:TIR domain-containing protein [Mycobacteriales bacterium]
MTGTTVAEHDVFLSDARADLGAVLELEGALRAVGLRVFRDSECVDEFDGISPGIVAGLASSRVLLAYYSAVHPTRSACQWELTMAFLVAQREGDPLRVAG